MLILLCIIFCLIKLIVDKEVDQFVLGNHTIMLIETCICLLSFDEYTTAFGSRPRVARTPDPRPSSHGAAPQPQYSDSLPTSRPNSGGRPSSKLLYFAVELTLFMIQIFLRGVIYYLSKV